MRNQKTTRRITDSILITLPPVMYGIRWAVRDRNTFKTLKNSDSAELRKAVAVSQELDFHFISVPDYLKNNQQSLLWQYVQEQSLEHYYFHINHV